MRPVLDKQKVRRSTNFFIDNLLKGVIIITPLAVTLGAIMWVFKLVDDILPDILQFFLNIIFPNRQISAPHIFGLGFLVFILLLTGIGYISSFFLFNKTMHFLDRQLIKTPGVKVIYTIVKDLIKTVQHNNKQFDKPVMFSLDSEGKIWRLGFITADNLAHLHIEDGLVAVYVPMSFSVAGQVYLVQKKCIKRLKGMAAAEAMKFSISGGFVHGISEQAGNKKTYPTKRNTSRRYRGQRKKNTAREAAPK